LKKAKQGNIRASHTQGLTKSDISVIVGTPSGKTKRIAYGENLDFSFHKPKKRKPEYTTLFTFGRKGRWKFTHNAINNNISATVSMGRNFDFHVLGIEDAAKLLALTKLKFVHRYIDREVSNKLDDTFTLLIEYYYQQFKSKISKTKRGLKVSLKANIRKAYK